MHALGRIKAEHQKVVIPDITVLMSRSLPENDSVFIDQEENLDFICCSRTLQLERDSFLELRGTPKYRKGKLPHDIPVDT